MNRFRKPFVLFKRSNGVYYYYVYKGEKRVYFSTGCKTKAKALEVAIKEYNKKDEVVVIENKIIRLNDLASGFFKSGGEYEKYKTSHGFSLTYGYLTRLNGALENVILPRFGKKDINSLTSESIEKWLLSLNCSLKTKNAYLSTFNIVLEWAYKKGKIKENVCKKVQRLKNAKSYERDIFTRDEINAILTYPWENEKFKTMCLLAVNSGLRYGEILALSVEDVNDGFISVCHSWSNSKDGIKMPKSGKKRIVPLLENVRKEIENISQNKTSGLVFVGGEKDLPHFTKAFRKEFQKMLKHTIKDYKSRHLCFHSFRHTFNTYLVECGISGEIIRSIIGHESKAMTDNYLHISGNSIKNVALLLESKTKG